MRANIRATRHMWTYEYTIDYIMGRIANTSTDLGLNEYRRNSTNCTGSFRWAVRHYSCRARIQSDLVRIKPRQVNTGRTLRLVL
jgi:hypothetical protein